MGDENQPVNEPMTTGDDEMGADTGEVDMNTDDMGGAENLDQTGENEVDDMDGEAPLKNIQKLTGKLTQKMRTFDELDSETIKYVLNSVISAFDPEKLVNDDRTEIVNKLENEESEYQDDETQDVEADTEEEPMSENSEDFDGDSKFKNVLDEPIIKRIIKMADLEKVSEKHPSIIIHDFFVAAYKFALDDYFDNYFDENGVLDVSKNPKMSEFANQLKDILHRNNYKPQKDQMDLEGYAEELYNAMSRYNDDNGSIVMEFKKLINL